MCKCQRQGQKSRAPRVLSVGQASNSATGGSFYLDRPASATTTESLAGGWTAELVAGSQQIVVHGPKGIGIYSDAMHGGLAAANQALDLVAMRGGPMFVLVGTDSRHIVWWTEPRGTVVRITCISDLGVSVTARATVHDATGNIKPEPAAPALDWHHSFRYFRLSQVTSDLFDAYRNMYLALEAVLSTVVPKKEQEGEGKWLERALNEIGKTLDLGRYAPATSENPLKDIYKELYAGTRNGLFHAKLERPILLPHAADNRTCVIQRLQRLSHLYLDLVECHLHLRKPGGGMTYHAFDKGMAAFNPEVVVSDDWAPEDPSDAVVNPNGGATAALPTRQQSELSKPGFKAWLGEDQGRRVETAVSPVRRVVLTDANNGKPLVLNRLLEPLSLEGVDVLQVLFGVWLVNRGQPRFRFDT